MSTMQVDRRPAFRAAGNHGAVQARPGPRSAAGTLCLKVMDTPNAPNPEAAAPPSAPADVNRRLAALLGQIADGDQAAFAEFYRLTSRRVFGMARRVLIDPELSEDTTQEVFL